jgi:hypothetical protein
MSMNFLLAGASLDSDIPLRVPSNHIRAEGKIRNFNTIEDFKNTDKTAVLQTAAKQVCSWCLQTVSFMLTLLDLGCYQRWHYLFHSIFTLFVYHPFIRKSEEVHLHLLVCFSCSPF